MTEDYEKLKAEHEALQQVLNDCVASYKELYQEFKYALTRHSLWDEEGYYTLPNGNTYEKDE